ncbi:MAG: glycerol-3-phosphate acyltransferase [Rhodobacterales bacterium]|nr:MAG: glycerol-3-phosphate acyltransferase [Rhodobacterales bacterium]
MNAPVTLPFWALALLVAFAGVTFASHFLFPSVRWFLRRRMERVVARLNTRLKRPIEPFKLARRTDMIQRLIYDPEVTAAVVTHAREEGLREDVAFEQAKTYAREIVPGFSATLYFSVATRIAKWLSRAFYDIRMDGDPATVLADVPEDACVIFVINHRSNMDYVLVTWLLARASALSYAVGEWARVWPLSSLIKMMGAYFIRRKSRGALYRKVLAHYVQMATRGGVTQAFFPEGGLSLSGGIGAPRLGLLSYVMADDPLRDRPVVFVPVALNYDRVLEDRILLAADSTRRFRVPWGRIAWVSAGQLVQRITRRFRGYGVARVAIGQPLALSDWHGDVEELGHELMARIASGVPVLPVPLVARLLLESDAPLAPRVQEALDDLRARGRPAPLGAPERIVEHAMDLLRTRDLVTEDGRPTPGAEPLLKFYAKSIAHHF